MVQPTRVGAQRSFLLAFLLAALCIWSAAQTTSGRILGRVTDETGASIAKVTVSLVNDDTGVARSAETNATGDYAFVEVPVGSYHIEFSQTGFQKNLRRGIRLDLNQVLTMNTVMKVGGAQEVVDVTSEAPLVDTNSTQLGAVVNDHSVSGLPLNARDTYQLLQLQPGVQGVGGADLFYGSGEAGAVSVNGGRGRANNFSVNGGDANDQFVNGPGIQPSPDSIQEFRVLTNTFDAEYGRNSGAVINVVTKSGTNSVHGNAFEFVRNNIFDARSYIAPARPDDKQNVFGGTFGGPLKKDKTFYFLSYEGRRDVQGFVSDPVFVPTAAQRNGDFSDGQFQGNLNSQVLANVLTQRGNGACTNAISAAGGAAPQPGLLWTQIFPNSVIPTACMDPVALDLMNQFVPLPNQPGQGPNVWQGIPNGRSADNQFTAKFDHRLSSSQSLNVYYYFVDSNNTQPFTRFEALTPNLLPGFGNSSAMRNQQWNVSHTWSLSPSAVNEFRMTYFREAQGTFMHPTRTNSVNQSCTSGLQGICFTGTTDTPGAISSDPALGIVPNLGPSHEGVPFVQILGGFTIGNDYEGELPQIGNTFQWTDNFTKVAGKHTFKFGGDVRRMRFDQRLYFDPNGYFTYSGGGTSDFVSSTLFPNYLMGIPDSYVQGATQSEHIRSTGFYLFAQDSWKVKPNLTLNYGLRWELNTPLTDIGHRVQTFRPGQNDTVFPCVLDPATSANAISLYGSTDCSPTGAASALFPTGLVVPGDKGVPAGLTQTYYKSFAPRIGLAWSPSGSNKLTGGPGKTSIRLGWGIFYNPIEQLVLEQFQGEPPFGGSSPVAEGLFTTPFVLQSCADGLGNSPCSTSQGAVPNPFSTVVGGIRNPVPGSPVDWSVFRPMLLYGELQPNLRSQYSEQYNFTIQRELNNSTVLTVGFVGSQGHRLLATHDINFGNPKTCLDMQAVSDYYTNNPGLPNAANFSSAYACGQFYADSAFNLPANSIPAGMSITLPYGPTPTVSGPNNPAITLVGLRPYSSPNCNPMTGTGCPADGIPVFSSIFAQDMIANSAYNSLQVSVERRMSKGLQFLAAYTFSKSLDNASTFEEIVNPLNPASDRSLSLFDARHRFVVSYMWEPPIPHYAGGKGKVFNGWAVSGITTFQSGFPIRIISNNDNELMFSYDFNLPGRPDQIGPFVTQNPKTNGLYYFNPNPGVIFQDQALGTLGTAPRSICCGPGINNFDIALHKITPINERFQTEFRAEFFNAFNHTQFLNPDGNFSDGFYFGRIQHTRDPRLVQFAMKLNF